MFIDYRNIKLALYFDFQCYKINNMENRPRTTLKQNDPRQSTSTNQKFKLLKGDYNELQSKYDIYKNGSPNRYEQNIDNLKAYHIKNGIKTIQLPAIDHILQELRNIQPNVSTNQRDTNVHPTIIQKYSSSNRFRSMVSDQQETNDFLEWFTRKQKQIANKNCSLSQKFKLSQSLIASGLHQMLTNIACVSRTRSELLKMLWNKQNGEMEKVFLCLHKQGFQSQKKNLQMVKSLHLGYQQQIIILKNQNYCLDKKLQQSVILNQSCINSLRSIKKQVKKYERIIKQLNQSNSTLKSQNYQLLSDNIQLEMKQKNISQEQARILTYQLLQLNKMKKQCKKMPNTNDILRDVRLKTEIMAENSDSCDLMEKKDRLIKFILERCKENPGERNIIMKGQLSDDDDQQIKLDETIQKMLTNSQIRSELRNRVTKPINYFQQKCIGTDNNNQTVSHSSRQSLKISIAVQTAQLLQKVISSPLMTGQQQQIQSKTVLQKKKIQKRHSLMLIQMNKMMEFKDIQGVNKGKRLSNFATGITGMMPSKHGRYNSHLCSMQTQSIAQEPEIIGVDDLAENKQIMAVIDNNQLKNRQLNILRRHHQSLISQKSTQFQNMINLATKQHLQLQLQLQQQLQPSPTPTQIRMSQASSSDKSYLQKQKQLPKTTNLDEQIADIRELVQKYMDSRGNDRQIINNPEKHLKKILTDTYKNLYVSKKSNLLKQMLRTSKNIFGNVIYQNKLIQSISMVLDNKDKNLMSTIYILLSIPTRDTLYQNVNHEDVNSLYFKIYFHLTIKSPIQNQFNIWNNYTTLQKLNHPSLIQLLRNYFSESKCLYLQLKIREFIGVPSDDHLQNSYYVQLNPLMMFILEVYLLQKQNYYDSYHEIVNFLSISGYLDIQSLIFLLDLVCLKEEEQKDIIRNCFDQQKQKQKQKQGNNESQLQLKQKHKFCSTDLFYRICVRYELPLFEFIKLIKLEQFKNVSENLQNQLINISDQDKWKKAKQKLKSMLKSKQKYTHNMKNLIEILDKNVKDGLITHSQPFLFFYRIVIHAAYF